MPDYGASLPTWWLVFLSAVWVPSSVSSQLIGTVVFPFQVAALAGKANKAVAFATANLITQILGYAAPFIGMASDRHFSRLGRRRPFIVAGQLLQLLGLSLMMEATSFEQLAAANALSSFGGMLWNTPYTAVQCDSVPTHQRGITAGMNGFIDGLSPLLGSMLGILLGEGLMDNRQAYMVCIFLQMIPIPMGLIATGSRPGLCRGGTGMCSIERPPPPRPTSPLDAAATGAWQYNRPCAHQYVGKSQSCMVTSGRLIRHAPVVLVERPCTSTRYSAHRRLHRA